MWFWFFLAAQLAATAFAAGYLWRRQRGLSDQLNRLREDLAALQGAQVTTRRRPRASEQNAAVAVESAEIVPLSTGPRVRLAQAAEAPDPTAPDSPDAIPDSLRGIILGVAAGAPALGFFAGIEAAVLVAAGIGVAAAMVLLALRPRWSVGAWAGVATGAVWAAIGLGAGAAQVSPIPYCVFAAFAGAAGLLHAHLRRAAPGTVMALMMSAATLALASQTALVGPAGIAFGAIVAVAALVGSSSLRLESVHLAAFGATLVGLYVLSGQDAAAIWFTPAATWAGALFLAIAIVRVPQLGARGVALAGVGALAPLLALGALHLAQHGLADPLAAAGAFAGLAGVLSAIIFVAAQRRASGLAGLKFTLLVLALGAFGAKTSAIFLALPAPFAAIAFAALALGLVVLDMRAPENVWRALACMATMLTLGSALAASAMLLNEAQGWPAWGLIAAGLIGPAILLAAAARFAHQNSAPFTTALSEGAAIAAAVIGTNLAVRTYFSGGAMLLQPVGFIEAGAHTCVWLLASLLLATQSKRGAGALRMGAAILLGLLALTVSAFCAGLWLTPYWSARTTAATPLTYAPLGFLAPAVLAWAHWVFWRARGSETCTRVALGAGALLTAAFVTLEATRWEDAPQWLGALIGAVAFALAICLNFAPGVVGHGPRRSYGEEDFHRDRARQQRI